LRETLDLNLFAEILRWDAVVGIGAAVGAGILAATERDVSAPLACAAGVVGVVIGAAIAGAAVIAAFMDQPFLRKLSALGRRPGYFLAPLVFTGLLGIVAEASMLAWFGLLENSQSLRVVAGAVSGFFGAWALASLIPDLVAISELADIKATAAAIPDDHPLGGA
jgi:hypothetical protein